jgi:hypothetical protein
MEDFWFIVAVKERRWDRNPTPPLLRPRSLSATSAGRRGTSNESSACQRRFEPIPIFRVTRTRARRILSCPFGRGDHKQRHSARDRGFEGQPRSRRARHRKPWRAIAGHQLCVHAPRVTSTQLQAHSPPTRRQRGIGCSRPRDTGPLAASPARFLTAPIDRAPSAMRNPWPVFRAPGAEQIHAISIGRSCRVLWPSLTLSSATPFRGFI